MINILVIEVIEENEKLQYAHARVREEGGG